MNNKFCHLQLAGNKLSCFFHLYKSHSEQRTEFIGSTKLLQTNRCHRSLPAIKRSLAGLHALFFHV